MLVVNVPLVLTLWLGGFMLAGARWLRRPRLEFAAVTALSVWACLGAAFGQSAQVWSPALALAILYIGIVGLTRYRDRLVRVLASGRTQAIVFLGLGPALTIGWLRQQEPNFESIPVPLARAAVTTLAEPVATGQLAYTDQSRSIPLCIRPADEVTSEQIARTEHKLGNLHSMNLIRAGEADPTSNCHGWVFTTGRYWLKNEFIETILADNGYETVEIPQVSDVILYRDKSGKVSHTGVVRLITDDQVLIESKWGLLGRFIHPPAEQPYGESWSYQRSARTGHLLRSLESAQPSVQSTD